MDTSRPPTSLPVALRALLIAAALAAPAFPLRAAGAETVRLDIEPAGADLFPLVGADAEPLRPPAGQLLFIGRADPISIADVGEITVVAGDGRQLPLIVEEGSLVREFGRIVSLRFGCLAGAAEGDPGPGRFALRWGPGVVANNSRIARIVPDLGQPELYRALRAAAGAGAALPGSSLESMEVTLESRDRYGFLWYLLPMALIFATLAAARLQGREKPAAP